MNIARMWRGYAIFALLMLAVALVAPPYASVQNSHQDQNRAPYVWEPGSPVSFVQNSVEPTLYKRPCQYSPDDRQSDLCAQWTSADWTRIGAIVAGVGIGFLLLQIFLTIRALEHTAKATEAMERQNEIAEQADRPHFLPLDINVGDLAAPDLDGKVDFTFKFKNHGTAPGLVKRYAISLWAATDIPDAPTLTYINENAAIPPNDAWGTVKPMKINLTPEVRANTIDGSARLYLFCAIEYVDASRRKHTHQFVQAYVPENKWFRPIDHSFWEYT